MRIGIPRSLFYYYYYPLWKTFFQELGLEVTTSPCTSRDIIEQGIGLAVGEACLPIKSFYGHVDSLKKEVDYIFIPRLVSVAPKEYICPKFMGLPDMIKYRISGLPQIIEPLIDCSKTARQMEKTFVSVGKNLALSVNTVRKAWQKAFLNYEDFLGKLEAGQKASQVLNSSIIPGKKVFQESALKIGMLGHGYNIYDPGISMGLIERLEKLGSHVVTTENLSSQIIEMHTKQLPKPMYWTLGKKAFGSAMHWTANGGVNGIIYLSAFGCGPDSLVGDLIERFCRNRNYPILILTVDEHTGEAGMATRIEAFIDLLERRRVS